MKKLLLTVLAAFTVTAAAQEAFPDIPAGHWAGEAVARIADLGIIIGFPDGTFRGNESFTRYQSALVVSRLLDVVQSDLDALKAMTDADIESLRNALQELASDVAAQGVRLNAVEGGVASISDDVVSNTARLDALENGGLPEGVLQDLQNQIAAARMSSDTAAAQAAAAESLARGADAQAKQNAAAIDAINDLLVLLNEQVDSLGGGTGGGQDIANIREFVILLRRDQIALRDRVAALEASDSDQAAAIEDLNARVTKIEEDLLVVSGSIGLTYEVGRLSGGNLPFDSDRVWGIGLDRDIGASKFSSGADDLNDDDDEEDTGELAQDRQDIEDKEGDVAVDLDLNVGFGTERNGNGDPRALNSFSAVIKLDLRKAHNLDDGDGGTFDGYVFEVDEFTTTFDPIGAAPLTFNFGEAVKADFTPYILGPEDDGFVATVGAPDFLAFLDPSLTIAYGEVDKDLDDGVDKDADGTADNDDDLEDTYYRALRGTLMPLSGETFSATGGVSFAQLTSYAGDNADAAADNQTVTVWGVDGQIGVSFLDIAFEYANSGGTITTPPATSASLGSDSSLLFVTLDADVASTGLPILTSFKANYRDIPGNWEGIFDSADDHTFDLDQSGFKVEGGLGLFIVDVTAYFDSYRTGTPTKATTAFGVDAAADLFAGFSLTAFFHSASTDVDGAVDSVDAADTERDGSGYDTGFGVGLKHDGAAENALISNLNLEFAYEQLGAGFDETHILAKADYELAISILTLRPYASFESFNDAAAASDDTSEIKVGTGLETEALNIFLMPSLEAAVNFRSNSHSDTGAADYTASELQWGVGIVLNEFLFPYSTLTARYGSYSGTNIQDETNTEGSGDSATDISGGDENNGLTQSTSGYEVEWDYYDLVFTYGSYTNNDGVVNSASQGYKIAYKVTF